MGTKFTEVYNCFLGKITDDMYLEMTPMDTVKDLQRLLIHAIPGFEFPRPLLDGNYVISTEEKLNEEVTEKTGASAQPDVFKESTGYPCI